MTVTKPVKKSQLYLLCPSPFPSHPLSTFRYFLNPLQKDFVLVCQFLCTSSTRPNSKQSSLPSLLLGALFCPGDSSPTVALRLEQGVWHHEWFSSLSMEIRKTILSQRTVFTLLLFCTFLWEQGSILSLEVPRHTRNPQHSSSICLQTAHALNAPATCRDQAEAELS